MQHRASRAVSIAACAAGLAALVCLTGPTAAAKEQPVLTGLAVSVDAAGQTGPAPAAPGPLQFSWPGAQQLGASLSFSLGGFSGERNVDLFAVLFEERPNAQERKHAAPLVKLKGKHSLAAGRQRLAFPELWHTAEVPGRRRYRLEVEVALKGAEPVQHVLHFEVLGPPVPEVEIISFDGWNPASSRQEADWQPGDTVQLNLLFELRGNQARRGPDLVLYAVMEEDRYLMGLDEPPGEWVSGRNWDARGLPAEDGVYQCVLQARLPVTFAEAWDSQHRFAVHAALDYGAGQPASAKLQGTIIDYHPGEERREPEPELRLIELDAAQRWDVRRVRPGL